MERRLSAPGIAFITCCNKTIILHKHSSFSSKNKLSACGRVKSCGNRRSIFYTVASRICVRMCQLKRNSRSMPFTWGFQRCLWFGLKRLQLPHVSGSYSSDPTLATKGFLSIFDHNLPGNMSGGGGWGGRHLSVEIKGHTWLRETGKG